MLVFFDTEFTNFLSPRLLSIGLVGLDDAAGELYCELDMSSNEGRTRRKAAADFVRATVLSQWGRVPGARCSEYEMGRRVCMWLLTLAEQDGLPLEVVYDDRTDAELLEGALRTSGLWEPLHHRIRWSNVSYMRGHQISEAARANSWSQTHLAAGLERHHALADARALRAGFNAVYGKSSVEPELATREEFAATEPALPRVSGVPVLYLDFDGVLHPEAVYQRRGSSPYVKDPPGHALFEHAELLDEVLKPYPAVSIVLSTSWARVFSYSRAAKNLPPALTRRCVGATWHREMDRTRFEGLSRGRQVLDDVARRRPSAWLAIDDDITGWGPFRETHVVNTHPVLGISEPVVLQQLRTALERFE